MCSSDLLFYAFTKSLPIWLESVHTVPPNMILTASVGGHYDALIGPWMKRAVVVGSVEEAAALGLPLDTDDSLARQPRISFALLDKAASRPTPTSRP